MNFKLSGLGVVAVWMKRNRRCCCCSCICICCRLVCHCGIEKENGVDGEAKDDGATAVVVINRRGCHRGRRSDCVVVAAADDDGDLDVTANEGNNLVNEML